MPKKGHLWLTGRRNEAVVSAARKLKTFQTAIGFYDLAIAARRFQPHLKTDLGSGR